MGDVPPAGEVRCLIFEVGGQRLAIDIGAVAGIIQRRRVIPAPLAPAFIEGLINLRGNILTVVSLALLLGLPGREGRPTVQVVLRLREMPLAFEADELIGIENLDPAVLADQSLSEGDLPQGVRMVCQHRGHPLHILDTQALVSRIDAFELQGAGAGNTGGRA